MTDAEIDYADQFGVAFPLSLTAQQFYCLPPSTYKEELIEGELIVSPPASVSRTRLKDAIRDALISLQRQGFVVSTEPGIVLQGGARTHTGRPSVMEPDVAVFARNRLRSEKAEGIYARHVLLAIEVVSPGNTEAALAKKIQSYILLGAYEVWILEMNRGVRVVKSDGTTKFVERGIVGTPYPLRSIDVDFDELFQEADY